MTKEQVALFVKIIETKNSWGKNEIKEVMMGIILGTRTEV